MVATCNAMLHDLMIHEPCPRCCKAQQNWKEMHKRDPCKTHMPNKDDNVNAMLCSDFDE